MNIDLIKKDIEAHIDELPNEFISGSMYNKRINCYCVWGWLAKVTGVDPAGISLDEESRGHVEHIEQRYGLRRYAIWTGMADVIISDLGYFKGGEMVGWTIAPAKLVIEEFIKRLPAIDAAERNEDYPYLITPGN